MKDSIPSKAIKVLRRQRIASLTAIMIHHSEMHATGFSDGCYDNQLAARWLFISFSRNVLLHLLFLSRDADIGPRVICLFLTSFTAVVREAELLIYSSNDANYICRRVASDA